ncbi:MAG: DsrE family protein [Deltaproteobacteria bacterium]|nr:DsrE family protein [Deltaproteobacteria bacterium]
MNNNTAQNNTVKKMILVLTHNANDDKSTVAFTIANAALSSGTEVGIFLASDGVELSRDGACDYTAIKPFKPASELVESFVSNGGVLWACSPCFQHRGMKEEETVEGAIVTGAGPMLQWIAEGATTLSL